MPRQYQAVWEKIISNPGKEVKVKVKDPKYLARVRKAVWKEKEADITSKDSEGQLLKKKWRLTCTVLKDGLTLVFKLVLTNSLENV